MAEKRTNITVAPKNKIKTVLSLIGVALSLSTLGVLYFRNKKMKSQK